MLYVVRAPESDGRPEKFIGDKVIEGLTEELGKMHVASYDLHNTLGGPTEGAQFYSMSGFTRHAIGFLNFLNTYVSDRDALFFVEGMTPLISFLNYWKACTGKKVKSFGIFHSSPRLLGDLFYGNPEMLDLEQSCLRTHSMNFVATEYLASVLVPRRAVEVVGLPLPNAYVSPCPVLLHTELKEVIWSHRWALDKNRDLFLKVAKAMPDIQFNILSPIPFYAVPEEDKRSLVSSGCTNVTWIHCETKQKYFTYLAQHKGVFFSCATLETFGYAYLEAVSYGWRPVVPDFASYAELSAEENKYKFDPEHLSNPIYVEGLIPTIVEKIEAQFQSPQSSSCLVEDFEDKYGQCVKKIARNINRILEQT